MTKKVAEPDATLYIYRSNRRIVAIAIGHAPPDIPISYDSLMRIPIVSNGNRPSWRAFTHHIQEPLNQALKRRRWPDQDLDEEPEPAIPPRNRGKLQSSPPRRRSQPRRYQVGDVVIWNGGQYKILAINGNGQVFARHTQTKDAVNINLEELKTP
jgi:hypothetical protein